MNKKSDVKRLSACAVCSALSFVVLYMGSLTQVFDLTMIFVCGVITAILAEETGVPYALIGAAVCTILSFALLVNKVTPIEYLMAGGLYPALKPLADRFPAVISRGIKLISFEVILTADVILSRILLPESDADAIWIPAFFVLGTVCFIIYDIALTRFLKLYVLRLRQKFGIAKFFK